jgi:hypothetical protein
MKEDAPPGVFAGQIIYPALGITLYIIASALGWFVHPAVGGDLHLHRGVLRLDQSGHTRFQRHAMSRRRRRPIRRWNEVAGAGT